MQSLVPLIVMRQYPQLYFCYAVSYILFVTLLHELLTKQILPLLGYKLFYIYIKVSCKCYEYTSVLSAPIVQ